MAYIYTSGNADDDNEAYVALIIFVCCFQIWKVKNVFCCVDDIFENMYVWLGCKFSFYTCLFLNLFWNHKPRTQNYREGIIKLILLTKVERRKGLNIVDVLFGYLEKWDILECSIGWFWCITLDFGSFRSNKTNLQR